MTVEITSPRAGALTTADRSNAVAESLKQIARVTRFADRKKGIRSYQSHVQTDALIPVLFVLLCLVPTAAAAVYYGLVASDRFVTEARFAVRPAIGGADKAAGSGSDDVGTSSGVPKQMIIQDSLIATSYIESRPMIEAIERLMPVRTMFSREDIDWIARFRADAPIEKLVKYWRERVKVAIDQGSGIISLTVEAFAPEESLALAQAIMLESERMVNELSLKSRDDALSESRRELTLAEERMNRVRYAMRDLRNSEGVLDAQKSNETNLKVIAELRKARIELSVQLTLLSRDMGPDTRRIQDMKTQIKDLDENIDKIDRGLASQDPERRRVLANAMTRFEAYDNERKDSEKYYAKVLGAYEKARIIASRQIEFFSPVVQPVLAESAEQPRRLLLFSLFAAGSMVLFAIAVIVRRAMR